MMPVESEDAATTRCVECRSVAIRSCGERCRLLIHKDDLSGWLSYYTLCGACVRMSWRDAVKLEGTNECWQDMDFKCKEWSNQVLADVARRLRVREEECSWQWQ